MHLSGKDALAIMPAQVEENRFVFNTSIAISSNNYSIDCSNEDQVDSLKANGIQACFINSSQTETNGNRTSIV
jgi:ATP-dependent DNA helicase RecQ